ALLALQLGHSAHRPGRAVLEPQDVPGGVEVEDVVVGLADGVERAHDAQLAHQDEHAAHQQAADGRGGPAAGGGEEGADASGRGAPTTQAMPSARPGSAETAIGSRDSGARAAANTVGRSRSANAAGRPGSTSTASVARSVAATAHTSTVEHLLPVTGRRAHAGRPGTSYGAGGRAGASGSRTRAPSAQNPAASSSLVIGAVSVCSTKSLVMWLSSM